MNTTSKILLVDDDMKIRMVLRDRLAANGYLIIEAGDGKEALKKMQESSPDLILLDLKMPVMDGMATLTCMKKNHIEIPVIILTAHGSISQAVDAMRCGAIDFLPKPTSPDHIMVVIQKALEQKGLKEENKFLRQELDNQYHMIVGESNAIKQVMNMAQKVAPGKTTVLIQGESGTGKQLLSRAIHGMSDRKDKPFVQVNCTTLSENLLESDLFGHAKGSFTGAVKSKKGRFELADKGTVFLDEIGDLSMSIQAKLLQVIEYGEYIPIGEIETRRTDVRIITATNKNLELLVEKGNFREDLFYRLKVMKLQLPPLRDRMEDMPLFAEYFLKKHALAMGKFIESCHPETLERLQRYSWPGNIRELENVIERAIVLAADHVITPDLLPPLDASGNVQEVTVGKSLEEATNLFKQQYIDKTLKMTRYNQTQAAKVLEINRSYLNRLVKDLDLQNPAGSNFS